MANRSMAGPGTAFIAERFRAQRGIMLATTKDIAEKSGLTWDTTNRALRGESSMALETFLAVARALGLDPAELIREAENQD